MKSRISMEKAVPVPARVKVISAAAGLLLLIGSVFVGMKSTSPMDMPVALANGDVITPPYYIIVDGEKVALVESKEAAEKVVQGVIDRYEDDQEEVLDISVEEDTQIEKMKIESGDEPPDILTAAEAEEKLVSGNNGEGYLTVVITKEETEREVISYEEKYKAEPTMYVGESKVATEGEEGIKEVTRKVISKNGKIVETEVIEEDTLKEPVQQVTLTGAKSYDGYGGGNIDAADEGVSYDPEATYDALAVPVQTICISSGYGERWGRMHNGTDLALAEGSDIYAADSGVVYHAGYSGGYGNLIKIDHGNGMQTYYAHCSEVLVSDGQCVERGEKIGLVGSTGNSTGPHLHFEVIVNGVRIDPMDFLDIE